MRIGIKNEEHHADDQKQSELNQNHQPAGEQRLAAVAQGFRAEQALHDQLVGAVRGGGEEAAAGDSRPEAVGVAEEDARESEVEIENLKLAQGRGDCRHVLPAAGDFLQDHDKAQRRAHDVESHLDHVGPDDRGHAAFEGVEQRHGYDEDDGDDLAGAEDDRDDDGNGEHAHAFGQRPGDQKRESGEAGQALAEAAADELVGGEHLAAEIMGQEKERDDDAGQQVSDDDLQKAEIALKRQGGCANNGKGAGFRRDDGEGDGPPGSCPAAQEVILERFLAAPEAGAEERDSYQVEGHDGQIQETHEIGDSSTSSGMPMVQPCCGDFCVWVYSANALRPKSTQRARKRRAVEVP